MHVYSSLQTYNHASAPPLRYKTVFIDCYGYIKCCLCGYVMFLCMFVKAIFQACVCVCLAVGQPPPGFLYGGGPVQRGFGPPPMPGWRPPFQPMPPPAGAPRPVPAAPPPPPRPSSDAVSIQRAPPVSEQLMAGQPGMQFVPTQVSLTIHPCSSTLVDIFCVFFLTCLVLHCCRTFC